MNFAPKPKSAQKGRHEKGKRNEKRKYNRKDEKDRRERKGKVNIIRGNQVYFILSNYDTRRLQFHYCEA